MPINLLAKCLILLPLLSSFKFSKKKFFYFLNLSFWISLITIIIVFQRRYQNDFGLYHLPFIEMLNEYKIVIGSTNANFRFGHTSILSYFSAVFNFDFKNIGLIVSHVYILSFYIFTGIKKIYINKINSFFDQVHIFSLIFIFLHINSLNKVGYDIFPLLFIVLSIGIINLRPLNNNNVLLGGIFIAYAIFLKTSVIFYCLIPIYLFFQNIKKIKIDKKFSIYFIFGLLLLIFSFISKFLISSCLIYPINFTCFESSWLNKSYGSPESVYLETSAWAKGWANQNNLNYLEYISNFNWLSNYMSTHFIDKVFFKILLPYILLLFIIVYYNKYISIASNSIKVVYKNNQNTFIYLYITILSCLSWFFSSPDIRYGYTQLVILCSSLVIIINNKFNLINKNILKYIFIVLYLQFFVRFLIYHIDVISSNYLKDNYFPNTPNVDYKKINKINIPIDNLCWDVKFPCVTKESQFGNIDVTYKNGYLFLKSIK